MEAANNKRIFLGSLSVLILSRRKGESFLIGENIKITVLSQRSNQVRIGIEAPRSMPVHREELVGRGEQPPHKNEESAPSKEAKELADVCE